MPKILRYPLKNIGEFDDYLKIDVVEYKPPGLVGRTQNSFALRSTDVALTDSIKNSTTTIILPIPQNIQDSNAASWTDSSLNPIEAEGLSAFSNIVGSDDAVREFFSQFGATVNDISGAAKDGTTQQAIQTAISVAALKQAFSQNTSAQEALTRSTGAILNQNVELLFNGIQQIRPAFQFQYDLIPRQKNESDRVKDIIKTFKREMTPSRGKNSGNAAGLFIKSPNVFNLTYMSGGKPHPFLHRIKPCALTSMSVNYTAAGTYATYSDATPVHMQLSLQFQELSLIYAEDYKDLEDQGDISVGY